MTVFFEVGCKVRTEGCTQRSEIDDLKDHRNGRYNHVYKSDDFESAICSLVGNWSASRGPSKFERSNAYDSKDTRSRGATKTYEDSNQKP